MGSAVHEFLARYMTTGDVSAEPYDNYYVKAVESMAEDLTVYDIGEIEDSRALGLAMIKGFPEWHQAQETPIWLTQAEVQFNVDIPGTKHQLIGKVDGVCRIKGELWIAEHKTAAAVGDNYRYELNLDEQIPAYLWAIEQAYGERVGGVVYHTLRKQAPSSRVKNPLFYRFYIQKTAEEMAAFEADLAAVACEMVDPRVYRNPTKDCSWRCPFKPVCYKEDYSNYVAKVSAHEELEGEDEG